SDIRRFEDVITEADIIVLQLEIPIDTVYEAIAIAKEHHKTVVLNPAPAQILCSQYIKKLDYIIPNETEAEILTGIKVTDVNKAEKPADMILKQGAKNIIITLGKKGVFFKNKQMAKYYEAHTVKAVDTTAAGDSFIGSFVSGISNNWSH